MSVKPAIDDFDLLNVRLTGSHLLDASAGTGKTYSLSFLYLRLILEQGLTVEEVVVATFTNAATAELKERIYKCLTEAEQVFNRIASKASGNAETHADDDMLLQLLETLRQRLADNTIEDGDELIRRRLRLAQAQFDRAQIYSINGFALHVLRTYAVTLGCFAPDEIVDDDTEMVRAIYLTLAQREFADFGDQADAIAEAVSQFDTNSLFALLATMQANFSALQHAQDYFDQAELEAAEYKRIVEQIVNSDYGDAVAFIEANIDSMNKSRYRLAKFATFTQRLGDKTAYYSDDAREFIGYFACSQLQAKLKKNEHVTFAHPVFAWFDRLLSLHDAMQLAEKGRVYRALMHLSLSIRQHLNEYKAERMVMTHDDVVRAVANGADQLTDLPYKALLLDEAQDTNGEQLMLFEQLFLHRQHISFFVGDPKQAIYGFRGGNVYTYLAIRKQVASAYRLPKNYRSSSALNNSINKLFANNPFINRSNHFAADSLCLDSDCGGEQNGERDDGHIDYYPIDSHRSNDESSFAEKSLSLVVADGDKPEQLAKTAAAQIVHLLNEKHEIIERNENGEPKRRALHCGDIAVLVRDKKQADWVKQALAELGLAASVTGKTNLYATDEAMLMQAVLGVILNGEERHLKALMLTPIFAYPTAALDDIALVSRLRQQLHRFVLIYQENGFAAMFYQLMTTFSIGAKLLQQLGGKRRLSNWMQLFECLQVALQEQPLTLWGLHQWLVQRIHHGDQEAELRLEDSDAVSIMTMHKAKGLQFNVVCLPFVNYSSRPPSRQIVVSHQHGLAALRCASVPAIDRLCQQEEAAEAMRLVYVALTRAVFHNIIVLQPEDKQQKKNAADSLWHRLVQSASIDISGQPFTRRLDASSLTVQRFDTGDQEKAPAFKQLTETQYPKWLMTSFSALQRRMHDDAGRSDDEADLFPAQMSLASDVSTDGADNVSALMTFPAGAKAGVVLHALYERYMDKREDADNESFCHYARELISDSLSEQMTMEQTQQLLQAIRQTAQVLLLPNRFCLQDIATNQQSIEMPFILHLPPSARKLLYSYFNEQVSESVIDGYLRGFIDYWFCYEGRFYVLDYKSNKLGEQVADYDLDAMQVAMDEHHYELQALIYTLALCQHLGIHCAEQYETIIGGYYYLFIRGMNGQSTTPLNGIQSHDMASHDMASHGIYYSTVDWVLLAPLLAAINQGGRNA